MEIAEWLHSLGLGQYALAFAENAVQWDVLPKLTGDDLKDIGVVAVGDRRRLLEAIALLRENPPAVSPQLLAEPVRPPNANEAERPQLTVMFCDLVGSTALSARLDPEDLRDVIGAYHRCCADLITEAGGFVAKYMGDGVLAYFGYPRAHEHDAEHAVQAGLALVEAAPQLTTAAGVPLQVRVGIATGLVVVGDLIGAGAAQEQAVVGETPNLAARLQALAEPGAVVIADGTRRLLGNLFELKDLGARDLKGIAGPARAWAALRARSVGSRFDALHTTGLTALVGREEESELLLRRWSRAKTGEGQVVLLSGEAGIGKSRLTAALLEGLAAEPHTRLRYFCSPQRTDSAFHPIIGQMERAAGLAYDDKPQAKLDKLDALLAQTSTSPEDAALFAEMLSLANDGRYPALDLTPEQRRQRVLEALMSQLEGLARRQPVLLIFEDLHWIDPTSLEVLGRIVDRIKTLAALLILTFPPEFNAPWVGQSHVVSLTLNRLGEREAAAIIARLVGNTALPADVLAEIIERTDGIPLFVEEMTKAVLEAESEGAARRTLAATPSPALAVPASLHASLMARLDRLGPAKEVAQIGSAIGREFSHALLASVARKPEAELGSALDRLVQAGLLSPQGVPPQASYLFKHALVQDAAYGMLLREPRRALHARIAETLESQFAETAEAQPEILAHHYTEAGEIQKSVVYWSKAGQRAMARSAMVEAAAQTQKGLDQLALLPEDSSRHRQELELTSVLGTVMQVVKGTGAPERGLIFARARELWEKLDYPFEFLHVPHGQAIYHAYCGELAIAVRLGEELLQLSRQRNEITGLIFAHQALGLFLMLVGRFEDARSLLEQIPRLYELLPENSLIFRAGNDRKAIAQAILGNVLFFLGFPEQALACTNSAIAEAERLAHGLTSSGTLGFALRLLSVYGDNSALSERVEQQHKLTTEQGFPSFGAEATMYRGWVKVNNGEVEEGIELLRQGAAEFRAVSPETAISYYLCLLAQALAIAGQIDEALPLLDDALRIVEATGEGRFIAELNRHKGELLLQKGEPQAAEALYRKALGIAREQQAKLWELRAAMSLARLWRDQGRPAEARDLLAPVYGWFTEGFDTADLKDAKALLDELG